MAAAQNKLPVSAGQGSRLFEGGRRRVRRPFHAVYHGRGPISQHLSGRSIIVADLYTYQLRRIPIPPSYPDPTAFVPVRDAA